MLAIEHNPTHIETTLSEGRGANGEGTEIRLGGITRKKNRKNTGLGGFARLLAGLVNKKTTNKGEGIPKGTPVTAENGTKKAALSRITEAKRLHYPKEGNSAVKSSNNKEVSWNQSLDGLPNFEFLQMSSAEDKSTKTHTSTPEEVSLKTESFKPIKEPAERKVPFKKGETAENAVPEEIQNASIKSKNEEKPLETADRSEKNPVDTKKAARKRFSLDVQDLRTQTGAETGTVAERGLKESLEIRNGSEREITVDLDSSGNRSEKPGETVQKTTGGENFEQLLARELQGDLSADIVRQAMIVLRDGGEGTIKLSLKPETLGKVKIHLEMAENRISGFIFVDNEEALRAFEQEIHTLEQSFKDSGFEASLNAALDYKNDGHRWEENAVKPFYSERFTASYEESGTTEYSGTYGFGFSAVNVLV